MRVTPLTVLGFLIILLSCNAVALDPGIMAAWPHTDFTQATVRLDEIISGGPGKDGIPAIDKPRFVAINSYHVVNDKEPVVGLVLNGEARAYPLRILLWHEIVNDVVGGVPVTITYCPLCNTSIVFARSLDGRVLDFGTTGNLRHSDMLMYDRQTESWWQQYGGQAIVGKLAGSVLKTIPSRLESIKSFRNRTVDGQVLIPNNPAARNYGKNPYVGYDRSRIPFLFSGDLPRKVPAMMRVIAIDKFAITLPLLRSKASIQHGDIHLSWEAGQNSALDQSTIEKGRDVGNVIVTRNGEDIPYVVTFAFAFFAFHPDGLLIGTDGPISLDTQ